jgi:hypothetical protein
MELFTHDTLDEIWNEPDIPIVSIEKNLADLKILYCLGIGRGVMIATNYLRLVSSSLQMYYLSWA